MADEQRPEDERPEDENLEQQETPEGGAGQQAEAGGTPPGSGPGVEPDEEDEEEDAREDLDDLTVLQDADAVDLDAVETSGAGDAYIEDLTNLGNINMGSQQTTAQVIGGLIPDDAPPVPDVFVDPEPFDPPGQSASQYRPERFYRYQRKPSARRGGPAVLYLRQRDRAPGTA